MKNPVQFKEDVVKPKEVKVSNSQLTRAMKINQRSLIIQGFLKGLSEQEIKNQVERELKEKVKIEYIYKVISEYRKESGAEQPTKGDKTREMVIHYLRMGAKPSVIADTLGITRSYVSLVKKDMVVLGYIIQGTINDERIASILGITEREVATIRGKYKNFIHNYS